MDSTALKKLEPIDPKVGIKDNVVTRIIGSIFKGDISENDRLVVQKMATQMGVSTTPIREALVQLAEIGVVELIPNRGAICRKFGAVQLREIFEIRGILEAEAARKFSGQSNSDMLIGMQNDFQTLHERLTDTTTWNLEAYGLDRKFHGMISEGCGNDRLTHEIFRSWFLMSHIFDLVRNHQNQQARVTIEHLAIIEALLRNENDYAATAMRQHINSASEYVVDALFPAEEL